MCKIKFKFNGTFKMFWWKLVRKQTRIVNSVKQLIIIKKQEFEFQAAF